MKKAIIALILLSTMTLAENIIDPDLPYNFSISTTATSFNITNISDSIGDYVVSDEALVSLNDGLKRGEIPTLAEGTYVITFNGDPDQIVLFKVGNESNQGIYDELGVFNIWNATFEYWNNSYFDEWNSSILDAVTSYDDDLHTTYQNFSVRPDANYVYGESMYILGNGTTSVPLPENYQTILYWHIVNSNNESIYSYSQPILVTSGEFRTRITLPSLDCLVCHLAVESNDDLEEQVIRGYSVESFNITQNFTTSGGSVGVRTSKPTIGSGCLYDFNCPDNSICLNQRCVSTCGDNFINENGHCVECDEGFTSRENRCVPEFVRVRRSAGVGDFLEYVGEKVYPPNPMFGILLAVVVVLVVYYGSKITIKRRKKTKKKIAEVQRRFRK